MGKITQELQRGSPLQVKRYQKNRQTDAQKEQDRPWQIEFSLLSEERLHRNGSISFCKIHADILAQQSGNRNSAAKHFRNPEN